MVNPDSPAFKFSEKIGKGIRYLLVGVLGGIVKGVFGIALFTESETAEKKTSLSCCL
jgi:hypothetical protein